MTTTEQLLILNARQQFDLIRSCMALAETTRQLADTTAALTAATETIKRQRGELECMALDLAEARAG